MPAGRADALLKHQSEAGGQRTMLRLVASQQRWLPNLALERGRTDDSPKQKMPTLVSVKNRLDLGGILTFNHISPVVRTIALCVNFVVIYSPGADQLSRTPLAAKSASIGAIYFEFRCHHLTKRVLLKKQERGQYG